MNNSLTIYKWLASGEGAAELMSAYTMRLHQVSDLKIGEILRQRLDHRLAALVLTQLDLRERAAVKFTRADDMLFTRPGLEQATSEHIAQYRAHRFANSEQIFDFCCGLGGDLIAFSGLGPHVTAVDQDPVHLFLAMHNARVYHPHADITPLQRAVENAPLSRDATMFIDPMRRLHSGKRTGYDSEPTIEWCVTRADRVAGMGIKTAPGIPREMVPDGWEMEMIALGSDLKEAVMWSPALAESDRRATVISAQEAVSLTRVEGDTVAIRNAEPGDWLHDVNPAVTNAGLVEDLARVVSADRIDAEIGFLVSGRRIDHPMVSSWRILDVLPWREKQIRKSLAALDIGPIDIRRRGLSGDVPLITKRLRGKGNRRAIIAMTRMQDVPSAIICSLE